MASDGASVIFRHFEVPNTVIQEMKTMLVPKHLFPEQDDQQERV